MPSLSLASRYCRWLPVVIVGISLLSLCHFCWRWRPSLWLPTSTSAPHHRCHRRRLVVLVGVSLSSAASCCCRHRRILVLLIGGVSLLSLAAALSANAHSILGLPYMQTSWSRNTKCRMVLLRYRVCGSWISSGRHPKKNGQPIQGRVFIHLLLLSTSGCRRYYQKLRM